MSEVTTNRQASSWGRQAAQAGKSQTSNPFDARTSPENYRAWSDAWDEADAEDAEAADADWSNGGV